MGVLNNLKDSIEAGRAHSDRQIRSRLDATILANRTKVLLPLVRALSKNGLVPFSKDKRVSSSLSAAVGALESVVQSFSYAATGMLGADPPEWLKAQIRYQAANLVADYVYREGCVPTGDALREIVGCIDYTVLSRETPVDQWDTRFVPDVAADAVAAHVALSRQATTIHTAFVSFRAPFTRNPFANPADSTGRASKWIMATAMARYRDLGDLGETGHSILQSLIGQIAQMYLTAQKAEIEQANEALLGILGNSRKESPEDQKQRWRYYLQAFPNGLDLEKIESQAARMSEEIWAIVRHELKALAPEVGVNSSNGSNGAGGLSENVSSTSEPTTAMGMS